jgi:SAM-dependent methyltransferase
MAKQVQNVLVNALHDKQLRELAKKYLSGRLIDIGCGSKPYQSIVSPYVSFHIGLDHAESPHGLSKVELIGTAYEMPVTDSSFDCALCTSVLEHLEEPEHALRECKRVLRSGGIAIYSVPFIWQLHEEPRDFFRFSKYGLKHLFEKAGFEIVDIRAISGFWGTFGQMFVYNLYRLNRGPLRWLHLIDAIALAIQAVAFVLDKIDRTEQWTSLYMVVARKP